MLPSGCDLTWQGPHLERFLEVLRMVLKTDGGHAASGSRRRGELCVPALGLTHNLPQAHATRSTSCVESCCRDLFLATVGNSAQVL